LRCKLDEYFGRNNNEDKTIVFLTDFIESIIQEEEEKRKRKLGKFISDSTLDSYKGVKNKILAFENYRSNRLLLEKINLEFHADFIDYMNNQELLTNNAIGFYISKLKTISRKALLRGYKIPLDFQHSDFYTPSNETIDIYLTEKEIEKVFNTEFEFNSALDNARDFFVIGLWTGLRVSDLLRLDQDCIEDGFIKITSQKTEIPVLIPIHPQVASILDKRLGELPRRISDQKFNVYIKEICKIAELTKLTEGCKMQPINHNGEIIFRKHRGKFPKYELVSSHICRRSFATNLYGKLSNMTIMSITGHKTEQSFLTYIKITSKEHAQKLQELWANAKE